MIKYLSYITLVLILVSSSISFSYSQETQNRKIEFNASKSAGIFYYDLDEIIKKLKLKDDSVKTSTISEIIVYNKKVQQIFNKNIVIFTQLDNDINSRILVAQSQGNEGSIKKIINTSYLTLKPINDEILSTEKELNNKLSKILSKRQFKKWHRLQKAKRDGLKPRDRNSNNESISPRGMGSPSMGGVNNGGFF